MVRIALGQIDPSVGDLEGNVELMTAWASRATEAGADVVVFPELAITGYPPEDLVLRPAFVDDNLSALEHLAKRTAGGCSIVTGFVDRTDRGLHNAAALVANGEIVARYHKVKLPNYGVFDEQRTFVPGDAECAVRLAGSELGLSVCEDAWAPGPPFDAYAARKTPIVLNINGSPYHRGKAGERIEIARDRALETGAWIVYVNTIGGQDELVFDGGSMVVAPDGTLRHRAAMFEEDLLIVDIEGDRSIAEDRPEWPGEPEDIYRALELGLGDYVRKNGFEGVVLGLSGGIDSAFVAVLATDALGAGSVRALTMPSRYSSAESTEDATEVARRLRVRLDEVAIDDVFSAYLNALREPFHGTEPGLAEENIQARIRGNLLMAFSNRFGSMVLATGNKSEYAVGYATLYGDMAGGFAPIKDVPKTLVYKLVRWRNAQGPGEGPIPHRVVAKAPSAELRPDQKDTDSLPQYEQLDPIIEAYVVEDRSPEEIATSGDDPELVERVVQLIDRAEYKRRQAAPGIKITPKAFGRDRRMPITNRYRPDASP
ncbi:MAG TPA: NAD+ synthase [Actinomycetota bacterium]|jgi:NAD+ synthase (glutamine-hydrolysing)|nr:NAD+ synthase [Actinomycetota bacterium]